MKLYTEEQVKDAFKAGMSACMKHKDWALAINYPNKIELSEYMQSINSIELPSDEDIYDKAVFHDGSDYSLGEHNGFINGAKYVIDKIQGGNK
jgi:hypothetical protein